MVLKTDTKGVLVERLQHKPLDNTLSDTQAIFAKPLHKYLLHMPSKKKPCVRPIVAFWKNLVKESCEALCKGSYASFP